MSYAILGLFVRLIINLSVCGLYNFKKKSQCVSLVVNKWSNVIWDYIIYINAGDISDINREWKIKVLVSYFEFLRIMRTDLQKSCVPAKKLNNYD